MNPNAIKPAGLPSTDNLAVPPPDPMLANDPAPPSHPEAIKDTKPEEKKSNIEAPKTNKGPNVTLAIIATIIIVLGIAALAVYAYLKQH